MRMRQERCLLVLWWLLKLCCCWLPYLSLGHNDLVSRFCFDYTLVVAKKKWRRCDVFPFSFSRWPTPGPAYISETEFKMLSGNLHFFTEISIEVYMLVKDCWLLHILRAVCRYFQAVFNMLPAQTWNLCLFHASPLKMMTLTWFQKGQPKNELNKYICLVHYPHIYSLPLVHETRSSSSSPLLHQSEAHKQVSI